MRLPDLDRPQVGAINAQAVNLMSYAWHQRSSKNYDNLYLIHARFIRCFRPWFLLWTCLDLLPLMPATRSLENVPIHRLSKAVLVLFGRSDCGLVTIATSETAILNPGFELLVPSIGPNDIYNSYNKLFATLILLVDVAFV